MKELASGTTARDLIPGVPEDIERLASRLIEYSEGAMTAVARLRSMDHGLWIGEAAESFSEQVGQLPTKLSRAAGAFQDAAFALRSYASVLREAQWTAGRAVELFEKATHCADQDLGSLGAEAQRLLETARGNVEAAARRTSSVLEHAGDAAPDRPGFLHRALHFAGEIAGGAVEATAGMATFAFKLTPTYQLIDPEGYVENLTGLGKGLVFGVTHPVSFTKAVVDWDTWAESPGRAIGHLLPTIALAAATAGAGSAGEAGAVAKGAEAAHGTGLAARGEAVLGSGLDKTASALKASPETAKHWRSVFQLSERKVQAKFKHAADFGVKGTFNPARGAEFGDAIAQHVQRAKTVIEGSYRGNPAVFYVDEATRVVVIQSTEGTFVSGWKMTAQQLQHVLEHGKLGGG